VSDASHELRTPLVTVRGYAELYRMGAIKKPKDVAEAMDRIESEAIRMSGLVESLLTLTRMDELGQLTTQKVKLDSIAGPVIKDASVANPKVKFDFDDSTSNLEFELNVAVSRRVSSRSDSHACSVINDRGPNPSTEFCFVQSMNLMKSSSLIFCRIC
jgi:signal transduction histidine kinase